MFDFTSYSDLDAFCMIDYLRFLSPRFRTIHNLVRKMVESFTNK